jgi:uncharacterized protein YjbJ (UPF0337 family)
MDWDQIERNWARAKGTIKRKWVKLTDNDLKSIEGRRERLEDIIHKRYGFAAEHVRKEVDDWLRVSQSMARVESKRPTPLIQSVRSPKR